jgi:hypothetical protein
MISARMCRLRCAVVLTVGILVAAAPPFWAQQASTDMGQLRLRHEALLKRMNEPDTKQRTSDPDDPRMEPLLDEGWQLAGEWAAAWLEQHPGATSKAMGKIFDQFSPPDRSRMYDPNKLDLYALGGFASRIGASVYVVSIAYYHVQSACGAGTFLVVARDPAGHLRPQWSVRPIAKQHFESQDEIGHWAYLGCGAYYNGPLIADTVMTLPSAQYGALRFAVNAFEATNGNTILHHLSLWQWDGNEAKSLLAGGYQDVVWDKRRPWLRDGLLTLPTTEVTSSFISLGAAEEPRGEWRIQLTPDKVTDLGHRFLNPQVAWLDALLLAVATGHDASTLASPEAIAEVQTEWKGNYQAKDAAVRSDLSEHNSDADDNAHADKQPAESSTTENPEEEPAFLLGFLSRYHATGPGSFAVYCDEAQIRVTYQMRADKPYITSVRFLDPK